MAKTPTQHLASKKAKKKVVLERHFAGIKAGQLMLVGTPQLVDAYVRRIPAGETRSIRRLRNEMARNHRCNATCPVSTAIFLRLVAQAALDEIEAGAELVDVAPFWRAVAPEDKLVKKLSVDADWIRFQRERESA